MSSSVTIEQVKKRDSSFQNYNPDRVKSRLRRLTYNMNENEGMGSVDTELIYEKAHERMTNKMTTVELDYLLVDTCLSLVSVSAQYEIIASRIAVECNHHTYGKSLSVFVEKTKKEKKMCYFNKALDFIESNTQELNKVVQHNRDFLYSYKTIEKNTLGRLQFVLLLLVVNDILTNWHNDEVSVLAMIKKMYTDISRNPKDVESWHSKLQTELSC